MNIAIIWPCSVWILKEDFKNAWREIVGKTYWGPCTGNLSPTNEQTHVI